MRVGFAGTPPFAVAALEAMLAAGFDVALVLTRPDRPKGRGLVLQPSAVKASAVRHGLAVQQPATLRSAEARKPLLQLPLDVLVVAAYGLILPPEVLAWPRHGALNIHASLLPRWRGAAPVERAILAGDAESGITIMQMDAGLDTGRMIERVAVPIAPRETGGTLHDKLAQLGAAAIVRTLRELEHAGGVSSTPQPSEGMTYADKIGPADAVIDWSASAQAIDRQVRAFDPTPGAYTSLGSQTWKVWAADPLDEACTGPPGTVIRAGRDALVVACGAGALAVRELQPAGGKRMSAAAVLAGRRIAEGAAFAARAPLASR